MLDIHCHLLPGIDDGPPDLEAALALARACVEDGITHAVVTPHVFPGRYENRRSNIEAACKRFLACVRDAVLPLDLSWAGEVRLGVELLELLATGELPFLGTSGPWNTLLLELPDGQVPLGSERLVSHLIAQHVRPVIAHPERNRAIMERPEKLRPFVDQGCAVQLTAGSLIGSFGSRAQDTARRLLDEGWVDAIASDAHNLHGRRPRMREAASWLVEHYGAAAARRLTQTGPAELCGRTWPSSTARTPQPLPLAARAG